MGGRVNRGLGTYKNLPTVQCAEVLPCPPGRISGQRWWYTLGMVRFGSREQAHTSGENWSPRTVQWAPSWRR